MLNRYNRCITTSGGTFFVNLALSLVTAIVWLGLAFATSRKVHRHAIVDVFWGAGFLVIYLESLVVSAAMSNSAPVPWWGTSADVVRWSTLAVVAIWSLRLSTHLAIRQRGHGEDRRYEAIMRGAKGRNETWYALRNIYLIQALLMWFVSTPLQWIACSRNFALPVTFVGLAMALVGIGFETIGDEQLRRFLSDPDHRGVTMDQGLWRYTRHPNYFGDAVVWWGLFVVAAASGWGLLTVMSPLVMNRLLTSVSGVPLLEGQLSRSRAGYAEYVARTSAFLPRRPKREPI